MVYTVVYEESKTGWGAYLPDVPGCIATGKTRNDVEKRIKSALRMHLSAMRRDGEPLPEPGTHTGTVEVVV